MITVLNGYAFNYELLINFIAHFLIFVGSFYVALQNRKLPQWHITPLWYVGLFSLLVCISVVLEWSIGPEYPLSYWNIGKLSETAVDVCIALVATIMLTITVGRDIRYRKKRKLEENHD